MSNQLRICASFLFAVLLSGCANTQEVTALTQEASAPPTSQVAVSSSTATPTTSLRLVADTQSADEPSETPNPLVAALRSTDLETSLLVWAGQVTFGALEVEHFTNLAGMANKSSFTVVATLVSPAPSARSPATPAPMMC